MEMAKNDMAVNCFKWPDKAGNGWKLLGRAGNGLTMTMIMTQIIMLMMVMVNMTMKMMKNQKEWPYDSFYYLLYYLRRQNTNLSVILNLYICLVLSCIMTV